MAVRPLVYKSFAALSDVRPLVAVASNKRVHSEKKFLRKRLLRRTRPTYPRQPQAVVKPRHNPFQPANKVLLLLLDPIERAWMKIRWKEDSFLY
mgnify:CR=1 FL=1